jgi:catabolite regulation protein CreA
LYNERERNGLHFTVHSARVIDGSSIDRVTTIGILKKRRKKRIIEKQKKHNGRSRR